MNKDKLCKQLEMHEGIRLSTYFCTAGKLTIGVGHNLDANGGVADRLLGRPIRQGTTITHEEAMTLLYHDIDAILPGLKTLIPSWDTLSDNRQRVLADMAFNLGLRGLQSLDSLLKYIAATHYELAAYRMLQFKWARQVGDRAVRLAKAMATDIDPLETKLCAGIKFKE